MLQQREVKLSEKDSSCVINNCLPGTTHFVRLIAIDGDGQSVEKSRQLTVQTSAPPDSPLLTVRYYTYRLMCLTLTMKGFLYKHVLVYDACKLYILNVLCKLSDFIDY